MIRTSGNSQTSVWYAFEWTRRPYGVVSAALLTLKADKKSIASTRSLFYVNDVFDVKDKVKHIKKAREVIGDSVLVKDKGANVFPFDYSLYGRARPPGPFGATRVRSSRVEALTRGLKKLLRTRFFFFNYRW